MSRTLAPPCMIAAALLSLAPMHRAQAVELPSILQAGDTFCTSEADFDDFASQGRVRSNSGTETCQRVTRPLRVAILSGHAGRKTMVRVTAGPMAYSIAWTNGSLPLPR